jgi:hypothetical protein
VTAAASAAPVPAATPPPAYRIDVERLISASSLASLIEARARLARTELDALQERQTALTADRDAARTDLLAQLGLGDRRGDIRDRLLRDALRTIGLGLTTRPLVSLSSIEQDAIDEQLALAVALRERADRLVGDEAALADTLESVAAKEAELARLAARSCCGPTPAQARSPCCVGWPTKLRRPPTPSPI